MLPFAATHSFNNVCASRPSENATAEIRCPVCNMKFSADEIEEHANACLEAQEKNLFTCYVQFSKETAVEVIIDDEENDLVPGCLKQDELICKVKGVLAGVIQSDEIVTINVRRSFCFSDFYD